MRSQTRYSFWPESVEELEHVLKLWGGREVFRLEESHGVEWWHADLSGDREVDVFVSEIPAAVGS